MNPGDAATLGYVGLYYAKNGDAKRGLDFIRKARAIDQNGNELLYQQAVVDTLAGQKDDAIESLKEAFQKGYSATLAKNDPEFTPLQVDPAFAKLLAQFGPK